MTLEEAAGRSGVPLRTLARYELGETDPPVNRVYALAAVYGISVAALLDPHANPAQIETRGYAFAGTPVENYEMELPPTPIPADIAASYEGSFMLVVSGNDLADRGITDGDRVLVHPSSPFQSGKLFVIRLPDGTVAARRLRFEEDRIRLRVANDGPFEDLTPNGIQVLGRIVWHLRQM